MIEGMEQQIGRIQEEMELERTKYAESLERNDPYEHRNNILNNLKRLKIELLKLHAARNTNKD